MEQFNFIHIPKNGGNSIREWSYNNPLIQHHHHSTDVFNDKLINQFIVIRNPIDRFISSVYYCLQIRKNKPCINKLIVKNINTPEKWLHILSDPDHLEYDSVMSILLNTSKNRIGNKIIKYKWIFSPQIYWVNKPKIIIIMDNFNDEIKYITEKYNLKGNISCINKTCHEYDMLSQKSKDFLMNFYKEDFILYEKYKNINIEKRC